MMRNSLRGLDQGGATGGQGLVWNATTGRWGPGTVGGVQSVVAGTGIAVDATDPANPVVSATGGGGSGGGYALDPATLNATHGDDFTGGSLNARWNRVGYTATGESFPDPGSTFEQDTSAGSNSYYWQTAPSGDFTIVMRGWMQTASTPMFGPLILDSSGNGVCAGAYNSAEGYYAFGVSAGAYGGTFTTRAMQTTPLVWKGLLTWWRLRKVGTAYTSSISLTGQAWRPWTPAFTFATTPTRIGFGNIFNTLSGFAVDYFDVQ